MKIITNEKIPIKMWLKEIEPGTEKQARNIANLQGAFHHVAIMPDAHIGYGMPIGGVLATRDIIVPNAVGVDIGCGMTAVKTSVKEIDRSSLKEIINNLKRVIPTGFRHHKQPQEWEGFSRAPDIPIIRQELKSSRRQIGTLGGGNHFVEVLREVDSEKWEIKGGKNIWLMLHSGSRNFGLKVASEYHKKAKQYCESNRINLPDRDLAFLPLESKAGQEYWWAMNYALNFAEANRAIMMKRFMGVFKNATNCDFINFNKEHNPNSKKQEVSVCIHHNYAAKESHFGRDVIIHRKGATSAFAGQLGIVPGSMGTPSYIIEGLGNPESFMSSAHGAGRAMGRKEADRKLKREEVEKAIRGLVFDGFKRSHDEAPQAYKNIEEIITLQIDLARPIVKLRPLAVMVGN